MTGSVRLGTRASLLATTQSGLVAELIRERLGDDVELVTITTEGDSSAAPLTTGAPASSSAPCARRC